MLDCVDMFNKASLLSGVFAGLLDDMQAQDDTEIASNKNQDDNRLLSGYDLKYIDARYYTTPMQRKFFIKSVMEAERAEKEK